MYFLPNKQYRKNIRKSIVAYLYSLYETYKSDKYSDDLIMFIIRSWHINCPLNCLGIILTFPYFFAMFTYISLGCTLMLYLFLDGCFLTGVEIKIGKKDVNVADPIIMFFGDDINFDNRIRYSIYAIIFFLISTTAIMYYRFW